MNRRRMPASALLARPVKRRSCMSDETGSIGEAPPGEASRDEVPPGEALSAYVEALAGTDDAVATTQQFLVRCACATLLLVAGAALLHRNSASGDVWTGLGAWALVVLSVGVFVHARVTGLRQLTASYAAAGLPLAVAQRCAARTLVGALPK